MYIDSPYGSPPDVNAFDSIILIAGVYFLIASNAAGLKACF
jgi:hypothetical protein